MLSKWEKQELLRILKCERSKKRSIITAELQTIRDELVGELEKEIADIKKNIDDILIENKLENFGSSCYGGNQTHERLAEFDTETDRLVREIIERR